MAHGSPPNHPVMDVRLVALYPGHIRNLAGRPGVRFRRRKKYESTLVPCELRSIDGRSIAQPEYVVPEGTPPPRFRAQFETVRVNVDERRVVCLLLAADAYLPADPEQVILSPIFDDGYRLIYEFQRAYILRVSRRGDVETRLVAVHPATGVVGTETVHRFDLRLAGLAARCMEHLQGTVDLFPPRVIPYANHSRIPHGEANLQFTPAHVRPVGVPGTDVVPHVAETADQE